MTDDCDDDVRMDHSLSLYCYLPPLESFDLCKGSIDTPTQKYSIHTMISYLLHLVSKSVRKMHIYGHPISMNF